MKKKIVGGIAVLAIAAVAAFNVNLNAQEERLSNISLANLEALAQNENGEDRLYETKRTDIIEIWDDQSQTYKKVTVTICEGKGSLEC